MKYEFSVAVKPINNDITAVYFNSFNCCADTKQCLADSFMKFVKLIVYKPSLCIINKIKACFNVCACTSMCNARVR